MYSVPLRVKCAVFLIMFGIGLGVAMLWAPNNKTLFEAAVPFYFSQRSLRPLVGKRVTDVCHENRTGKITSINRTRSGRFYLEMTYDDQPLNSLPVDRYIRRVCLRLDD